MTSIFIIILLTLLALLFLILWIGAFLFFERHKEKQLHAYLQTRFDTRRKKSSEIFCIETQKGKIRLEQKTTGNLNVLSISAGVFGPRIKQVKYQTLQLTWKEKRKIKKTVISPLRFFFLQERLLHDLPKDIQLFLHAVRKDYGRFPLIRVDAESLSIYLGMIYTKRGREKVAILIQQLLEI